MRKRQPLFWILSAILALQPAMPATAVVDGANTRTAGIPSKVWLNLLDTDELDRLQVSAGRQHPDLYGDPGTWICISAERSSTQTEFRRGYDYEITTEEREHGCTEDIQYSFDQTAWSASVTATIPTTTHMTVREHGPYGWELIDETEESAVAPVRLTWTGVGGQRFGTWMHPPSICYTFPPSPCFYGAGATSSRAADVAGRIVLGGLSQISIATTRWAGMRWWAGW